MKNLTGVVGANINTKTAAASRYALNSLWLAETNSLHKRVGDLRLEKTTADGLAHRDGLWANYYHDFAGGGGVTTGVVGYEREQAKNWYELGLGGTVQLSDSTNAYAEINKYFGDTKSNLVFNVGVRYSF